MQFLETLYDSELYHKSWHLRQQVLRDPLGISLTDADRQQDARDCHFVLVDGTSVVACIIASPLGRAQVKLRQMAVEPSKQGHGLGARLVYSVEATLALRGVHEITLHARLEAAGFYQRLGYAACGEVFTSVGIDHMAMHKQLDVPLCR